jgi:hypothetical protein
MKPAVPRDWLFAFAATVWLIAGAILCTRASIWLLDDGLFTATLLGIAGILIGVIFYASLLVNVVHRNISRIRLLPERACLFAFTAWRGYCMIGIMVTLGIALRRSALPKEVLIIPYSAMGGALVLAAIKFATTFWKIIIGKLPSSSDS